VANCTAVVRHRARLFPGAELHFYVLRPFADAVRHNPFLTVHEHEPSATFYGDPQDPKRDGRDGRGETRRLMMLANGEGADDVHAPVNYMNEKIRDKPGNRTPGAIVRMPALYFGLGPADDWRPMIFLTPGEVEGVDAFFRDLPAGRPRVMLETGEGYQSPTWTPELTGRIADRLARWDPVFLCPSKPRLWRPDGRRFFSLAALGFRQLTEAYNRCRMFVGCSSGPACVTCADRCDARIPRVEHYPETYFWRGTKGNAPHTEQFAGEDELLDRLETLGEEVLG
jgi:hypothetical protein